MVAAQLGRYLYLGGSHETQRRRVRAIIQQLRDNGARIVATRQQGYWLTEDAKLWRDYLDGRNIDAKRILAQTHKKKRQFCDDAGQGVLFDGKIVCGCATMKV